MDQAITTVVRSVTVYPDRARVTRSGKSQIADGTRKLIVDELPLALDVASVRAGGRGSARVRVLGVDVRRQHYRDTPADRVRELQEQLQSLDDERREHDDTTQALKSQLAYLDGLRAASEQFARGLAFGRMKPAEQADLLAVLLEQDTALRARLRAEAVALRELEKSRNHILAQLKELQAAQGRQRMQATVEVEVLGAGDFELELSYVVTQAGWQPLYDVRLNTDGGAARLSLTQLAQVTQQTGEAWEGVALALSTARPALNQRVPELHPWFIDEYRPPEPRMMRAKTMMPEGAVAAMAMPAAPPQQAEANFVAEQVQATVEESGTAVTFNVPGGTDVPGDGTPRKTTIQQYDLPAEIDYMSVPRHTDAVYRRVKLRNTTGVPLLDGPLNLFADEVFFGQNQLQYTPQAGEVELLLGVEERITVKRELVERQVDKGLIRRDRRTIRYGYEITFKNLLAQPAKVSVEDQIPVARHEQIKVRLEQATPQPTEQSDLNIVKWSLTLAAGSEQKLRLAYTVEHPRDMRVSGLAD